MAVRAWSTGEGMVGFLISFQVVGIAAGLAALVLNLKNSSGRTEIGLPPILRSTRERRPPMEAGSASSWLSQIQRVSSPVNRPIEWGSSLS